MHFWKMNGAGNDFIVLDLIREPLPPESYASLARALCERHLSLGADGLMLVDRADDPRADFRMLFFNADGSAGEMCGNGARCICRYGYENGYSGERQTVQTTAGLVTGERLSRQEYRIELNRPTVYRADAAVRLTAEEAGEDNEGTYLTDYIELGDPGLPHCVLELPDLEACSESRLFRLGRALRFAKEFPKGANVNFYCLRGDGSVLLKTYERGVEDFTYACGTGTGSAVLSLVLRGRSSGCAVPVIQRGGILHADIVGGAAGAFPSVYLTGPTAVIARGDVCPEELPQL